MNETLYEMMDWAGIEAIVYSEEDQPQKILGARMTPQGVLVQAFFPAAKEVFVCYGPQGKQYPMELEDEAGFFAALLPEKKVQGYHYQVVGEDALVRTLEDPYRFEPALTAQDLVKFNAGICYDIYEKLGAHPMTIDGVHGVHFAVWAPNAVRVSVTGDFNAWDGRALPMRRLGESGVFALFVPGLTEGTLYKYEIKAKGGLTFLKADPYANCAELRPQTASVVTDLSGFAWTDEDWMTRRAQGDLKTQPVNIYEVHPGTFAPAPQGRAFLNFRELAPKLAAYLREMGYTHVELMPVMEYPSDESMGYQTTGYYAPTARYGTGRDLMYFVNYLHQQGIGVILDWVSSQFPRDQHGLIGFDGTCLYEHQDPRQGVHPIWNTLLYNYGRPEVSNFLIGSALFWTKVFHADGLRLNDVSSILYLDYGKSDGQWIANIYGGNENLEGAEFLKHLNSILHKQVPGVVTIAEEARAYPGVTRSLEEGGLGFDFKWNDGYNADLFGYMQLDPIFRGHHHGEITFSMIYHYSEQYLLALSHDEVVWGKGSFLSRMPGRKAGKLMNLRALLGYTMVHPGKKLLFMGQEDAPEEAWEATAVRKSMSEEDTDALKMRSYVKALGALYRSQKALWQLDYDPEGFEWINEISANENMLVFLRKTGEPGESLLVVCNFSPLTYEQHKIGVPFAGKYKEIFNSDRPEYGGSGMVNPRLKNARADECDGRPYSIRVTVPPMGICVFTCTKSERSISGNEQAGKRARAPRRKTTSLKEELVRKMTEEEQAI